MSGRPGHEREQLPPDPESSQLPPDPGAFDSPRAERARAKGLSAPYIAGGGDPELEAARSEERRLLRWLVVMVVAIVLSGFVLGIVAALVGTLG